MAHPRVDQLRFARSEWKRGLRGLSEEDAQRRLLPMNSISWMVGHLAWHERLVWAERGQGLRVEPLLDLGAHVGREAIGETPCVGPDVDLGVGLADEALTGEQADREQ